MALGLIILFKDRPEDTKALEILQEKKILKAAVYFLEKFKFCPFLLVFLAGKVPVCRPFFLLKTSQLEEFSTLMRGIVKPTITVPDIFDYQWKVMPESLSLCLLPESSLSPDTVTVFVNNRKLVKPIKQAKGFKSY